MSKELDRAVVEELYRRYWFQVLARCRRILADAAQADDAAQEVFVRLLTRGGDFRAEAEWMTWLWRVATNVCLNRIRDARRRGAEWLDRATRETAPSKGAEPADALVERRQLLLELLDRFDPKTQQVVVLYYIDELDQAAIGELVGLSRVSVNKRLQKFRERARSFATEGRA